MQSEETQLPAETRADEDRYVVHGMSTPALDYPEEPHITIRVSSMIHQQDYTGERVTSSTMNESCRVRLGSCRIWRM